MLSMTSTGIWSFADSNLKPSCSWIAVKIDGPQDPARPGAPWDPEAAAARLQRRRAQFQAQTRALHRNNLSGWFYR
jgi:hypothetical protein